MMEDLIIVGTVGIALFVILWVAAWGFCVEFANAKRVLERR
ncbi:hypothetical protein Natoc_2988 [Natronococcus occultus SP4]|uniref:Uncharacterized protein n=1 Tax=Natronococcus occultus SP4 TaxID=694430 RepID=L0K3R5_9EURY|nr:hypothetical protein Natoc_2988 [Natronococcus occultus SP4]